MSENKNGREIGAKNLQRFLHWIAEREAATDWADYVHGGKLSRTEIATECDFALSVVRQNPAVKDALVGLEERLRSMGVLPCAKVDVISQNASDSDPDDVADQAVEGHIAVAKNRADQRMKVLEEQNATLKAEVRELREQLRRYKHIDDHLVETGRMVRS